MENCIFCQIASKKLAASIVYEDSDVVVFPDKFPSAPIHLLIIPKKHISEFVALEDFDIIAKMAKVARKMIHEKDLNNKGYRLSINGGGYQDIDHLHLHVTGPMQRKKTS